MQINRSHLRSVGLIVFAVLMAQTQTTADSLKPNWMLRVEVSTDKSVYTSGDPIYVTSTLANDGQSVVYVAKTFFESGGGIAGFQVTVKQLSGKRSGKGCSLAADRFGDADSRSAAQILKEDFLRLPPGGVVGYRTQYSGCAVASAGEYQITATYCACDLNTEKVKGASDANEPVVSGILKSKPLVFQVRHRTGIGK